MLARGSTRTWVKLIRRSGDDQDGAKRQIPIQEKILNVVALSAEPAVSGRRAQAPADIRIDRC